MKRRTDGRDPGEFAGLLSYLNDLGFGDLYLSTASGSTASGDSKGDAESRQPAPEEASSGESAGAAQGAASEDVVAEDADAGARSPRLASLQETALGCTACGLSAGRYKVVFGSGDPNADLMFIGEGPGANEDRQGLPFVGRAGELLTRIIEAIDLTRDRVYIANIVKCRPPNNRDPKPEEVQACRGYLEQQIELIRPKVIVALGRVAGQTLVGSDTPLGRMRGQWYEFQGVTMRVTYHPAALLRNPAFKRPTWEDMQVVRDRLKEV